MIIVYSILDNIDNVEFKQLIKASIEKYINEPPSQYSLFLDGIWYGQVLTAKQLGYITQFEYDFLVHDVKFYYFNKYPKT